MTLRPNQFLLLSLLTESPGHPYALHQAIKQRQLDRWAVIAFSSVYQILRAMEAKGMVTSTPMANAAGPQRRLYALTDLGRSTVAEHQRTVLGRAPAWRMEFELALIFQERMDPDEALDLLRQRRQQVHDGLEQLAESTKDIAQWPKHTRLVTDHSRLHWEAELTFLDHAIEILTQD
ncbi:MAG: PadR family transcriptional regulator [Oligoflexia bacterium]|nr:PadR family transcriptional regulator [Oligoflexia bacterium]